MALKTINRKTASTRTTPLTPAQRLRKEAAARSQRVAVDTTSIFPVEGNGSGSQTRTPVRKNDNAVRHEATRHGTMHPDGQPVTFAKEVIWVPTHRIRLNTKNPRREFDQEHIDELAESMKKHGVLEAWLVRPIKWERDANVRWETDDQPWYENMSGDNRLLAARQAGLAEVPVEVKQVPDDVTAREIMHITNIHKSLSVVDKAHEVAMMWEELEQAVDGWRERIEREKKLKGKRPSAVRWEDIAKEYEEMPEYIRNIFARASRVRRTPTLGAEDVYNRLNMSERQYNYLMGISRVPENVQEEITAGKFSQKLARPISSLSTLVVADGNKAHPHLVAAIQIALAKEIKKKNLGLAEANDLSKALLEVTRRLTFQSADQRELAATITKGNWHGERVLKELETITGHKAGRRATAEEQEAALQGTGATDNFPMARMMKLSKRVVADSPAEEFRSVLSQITSLNATEKKEIRGPILENIKTVRAAMAKEAAQLDAIEKALK